MVFFERNFKSSHTQVQSVAIPLEKANQCMSVFMSNAEQLKVDLVEIPERSELKEIVPVGQYLNILTTPLKVMIPVALDPTECDF